MSDQSNSMFRDFTRGGQTTMHSIRMFWQISCKILSIAFVLFLLAFSVIWIKETPPYSKYILQNYAIAKVAIIVRGPKALQTLKGPEGQQVKISIQDFMSHPTTLYHLDLCLIHVYKAISWSLSLAVVFIFILIFYLKRKGSLQKKIKELRGGQLLKVKKLSRLVRKSGKASDLKIGEMPLIKDSEVQHILLTGTTGAGKTVCLMELMDQVRAKGQRAIIYDIEGSFIPHYYRPEKDVILNPFDLRCPDWNIWQECCDKADFEAIAASLMPLHLSGSDPFWIHSARTIFAALGDQLRKNNNCNTKALLQPMFTESLDSLASLLKGTVAESLVSEKIDKTALSIKATLSTYCKALLYLNDDNAEELFSIRKWVQAETQQDSWLFITSNSQKIDALRPVVSVWIDVAAKSILSMQQNYDRRIWLFIDELPSLHRLPSISSVLSRGRKYGVCVVAAIQDIHQVRLTYGRDEAETLMALFNTNFMYRTKCPDTASWMSRITGNRETIEQKEGLSYGANDIRDGVSINQERRKDPIILETEFLKIDDLEAYLVLPGNWAVTKLKLIPKKRDMLQPILCPRDVEDICLYDECTETPSPKSEVQSQPASGSDHTENKIIVPMVYKERQTLVEQEVALGGKLISEPNKRLAKTGVPVKEENKKSKVFTPENITLIEF